MKTILSFCGAEPDVAITIRPPAERINVASRHIPTLVLVPYLSAPVKGAGHGHRIRCRR